MDNEPELKFSMLHTRKPKRGTCLRCFTNPTEGILQIQVLDFSEGTSRNAVVSLTSSLCLECLELMYRAIATSLTQPVIFGDQDNTCPRCQRSRPVVGRIQLLARKTERKRRETKHNPTYISLGSSTYRYCESCTVYAYRGAVDLRDNLMGEGHPEETHSST